MPLTPIPTPPNLLEPESFDARADAFAAALAAFVDEVNALELSGGSMEYTINGQPADDAGNFVVDAAALNAADLVHTHAIADVTGLQAALDGKAGNDHVHDYVVALNVNETPISGAFTIQTAGQLTASVAGQVLTLTGELPTTAQATSLTDAGDAADVRLFVGTQAEWDAFTPAGGVKYIVYIHG